MKKIILAGGSGFLGRALGAHFRKAGWKVVTLTRQPASQGDVAWDGVSLGPWKEELEQAAAVVNLSGRTVNCRYTAKNRAEILQSRVGPTTLLGRAIAQCASPPPVWLNASTATVYRHTFGPAHDENGETGMEQEAYDAFSVEVARAWENALGEAAMLGVRKIPLRMAMVLGLASNSVFPMLRRLTRLGLGGRMASGKQFVSWIHEDDFCRAVRWIIEHEDLKGPVNLAAPNPLPNAEMMKIFRETFGIPFGLPAERWMLELGACVMRTETELILKSRRVVPGALLQSGFQFSFPDFRSAIENLASR